MSRPAFGPTNIALLVLALLAPLATTQLTGCEKKAPTSAAIAVTKADLVGTWRLAPGGEYALANMIVWSIDESDTSKFTPEGAEDAINLLKSAFLKDPPTYTFRDDMTIVAKTNRFSSTARKEGPMSPWRVTYVIGDPAEFSGTYAIERDQVILMFGKKEPLRFDYTDRTLDRRHPDPKAPTFRLFKD